MSQLFLDAGSIKKEVDNCFLDAKPPKLEHAEGTQTPAQMDSKVDLAKPMKREKQRECGASAKAQPKQKRAQSDELKATGKLKKKARKEAEKRAKRKAKRKAEADARSQQGMIKSKCSQIKLAFIATNRSPPLSAEHMVRLQQVILDLTVSHTTPNVFPQFEDCAPQSEWLLLVCANRQTADWVRHNFAHMRQKSGLSIELLEDNQVPRNRIDGYFPNSAQLPDDKVLALINAQNPIKTRQWRIIRRAVNGHLLHLSMAIDDDSMHKLGACGGYISYCFGSICLNLNLNRSPMDQAYDSTDQIGSDWNSILTQLENLHVPIGNNSEWHYPFNQAHNAHN
ncbi:uncharacterized protein [Drosophila virilis]|uniref:uncharacterized protein n=1 Tax=Drosophila virilis TaxID=7244 RepID=UPI00139624BB|nr:uncharacterized protein LOC26531687 [Drosophila virilis]